MVIGGMKPAISSWESTITLISGTTARTTPRARSTRSTPTGTAWPRSSASSRCVASSGRPQARYPRSRPSTSARLTSRMTRQSRMLVHVLGGWRRGCLAIELLDLGEERGQRGPAGATGPRNPASPQVAGPVDEQLHV